MRRGLLLFAWTLAGCHGCERASESATLRGPLAQPAEEPDAGRRPGPLHAADLEGIFPPRWGVGDEWTIRTSTILQDPFHGPVRRTVFYRFRVMEVPRQGVDQYLISTHGGTRHAHEHYALAFHVPDFTMTLTQTGSDWPPSWLNTSFSPVSCPYAEATVFAFPSVPPLRNEVPPRYENPLSCPRQRFESTIRQTIEPTPEGLRIFIEAPGLFAVHYVDMLWRRGDPWWSSVRVTLRDRDPDDGGVYGDASPGDSAFLVQPGEPLDLAAEVPDASDSRR